MSEGNREPPVMRGRPRPAPRRSAAAGLGALVGVFAVGALVGGGAMIVMGPSHGSDRPRGSAGAGPVALPPGDASDTPAVQEPGYISAIAIRAANFLPAPPEGARSDADRKVYQATRAMKDTPRWTLAQNDADQNPDATLKDFSCAVGVDMTQVDAPLTYELLRKFSADQTAILEPAKTVYKRQRPFVQGGGDICIAKTDELTHSPDYPSGHGAWGWAVALILSELVPDRADPILARGRAFGESRVICGAHNVSAVEAGQMLGAGMVSAAHGSLAFRSDMVAATTELDTLRKGHQPLDPGKCQAEAALVAKAGY